MVYRERDEHSYRLSVVTGQSIVVAPVKNAVKCCDCTRSSVDLELERMLAWSSVVKNVMVVKKVDLKECYAGGVVPKRMRYDFFKTRNACKFIRHVTLIN